MKLGVAGLLAFVAMTAPALAQGWPTRPLTMVVAFPAGGSDDILGRIVAPRLSGLLGQPVEVANMSGGGGMTATLRVAKAAPDGYEFMLGTSATHALSQVLGKDPPYDSVADFAPVALLAEQPFVLIARRDLPGEGLRGFIASAKANQAKMKYGSAGAGSATHLVCAMLGGAAGIEATHVASNGGVPAMQSLVAGRTDYFCPVVTIAIPEIASQRVKAVAILGRNRTPVLPDVPSAQEQGLADFTASTWFGLFLPKGAPAPVIKTLHDAAVASLETPAVQAQLKEIGAEIVAPERRTPSYLKEFLDRDIRKWRAAIKSAGL